MGCVLLDYFRQLFTSNGPESNGGIFQEVRSRVSLTQSSKLSRHEIELALKETGPTKSPGLDRSPLSMMKLFSVVFSFVLAKIASHI